MASQITSLTILYSTIYWGVDQRNIKAPPLLSLWGEFTGAGEFPAQRASNAKNVSIWWRHHLLGIYTNFYTIWHSLYIIRLFIIMVNKYLKLFQSSVPLMKGEYMANGGQMSLIIGLHKPRQ